ncbi:MAG TPA: ribosomal RNA small subunit methyltransferase A, partial [Verrucomicrobiales bacterium]|nr:ribosomal RNA small subunit methyltransferase A [Verrucomicrobiales bacterium]
MTISEMRRCLEVRGLRLTKSLGQNFLHDGNQLRRIVASAELASGDQVLEIGPGLGPLTELLLASGARVTAVEMDGRLCEFLRERFAGPPRFELIHGDALKWLGERPRDWTNWKLVSNLPYSVGSPILVELALAERPPERLVVTLQLEVVRRLAAAPDTDDYGVLTLLVGLQFESAGWFKIPRDCFYPVPDVDSACITLVRRSDPLLPGVLIPRFASVVKAAFGQRRKMARKLLRNFGNESQLDAAFRSVGIPV